MQSSKKLTSDFYITSDRQVKIEILPSDFVQQFKNIHQQGDNLIIVSRFDKVALLVVFISASGLITYTRAGLIAMKVKKNGRFVEISNVFLENKSLDYHHLTG